jgi:hypothetical protein
MAHYVGKDSQRRQGERSVCRLEFDAMQEANCCRSTTL